MPLRRNITLCKLPLVFLFPILLSAQRLKTGENSLGWRIIPVKDEPEKREDCAFVEVNGKFYLIGGRGVKHVAVFDPATSEWTENHTTPFEINHFQPVVYKNEVYVVGGMFGGFPHEKTLENIYVYNPEKDAWRKGAEIPKDRRRGSGGTVVYKNKIYFIGGITDGHYDGTVNWLDEFDMVTGKWQRLKDAPHARDHFNAVVINDKIYLAGGRRTSFKTKDVAGQTESNIDTYDLKNGLWKTLPEKDTLPTARAGCTAVSFRGNLVVIGGESKSQESSHHEVQEYNTKSKVWKSLPPLVTGRHDTQAIFYKYKIYIAAGSANSGGGPDQSSIEVLEIR